MWSLVVVAVVLFFYWKFGSRLRMLYWINRQLPGPKYSFPTGNIAEVRKYDHVCEAFSDWSRQYGPTFRAWLGPFQCVVISTEPNHLKQMMIGDKDRWDVGERAALRRFTGNSLLTSRNPVWQHQRSLMNPAFHFQNLRDMTPVFDHYVKPFIASCESIAGSGQVMDIGNALTCLTLDIIGRSAFGTELHAQNTSSPSPLLPKIRSLFDAGTNAFTSVLMGFLPEFMFPVLRRQKEAVQDIRSACRKIIEQRLTESKTSSATANDLLGLLVGCKDENGHGMPMEQMIDEAMAFLLAGFETTSTLMTWLFYALAKNPEADAKLYKELQDHAAVVKDRAPNHTELRELSYLTSVIEETCRLYPPIPLLARQARDQDNFLQLRNEQLFVPRGGVVMLNTLGVHRDERHWKEPLAFRPERFARRAISSPKSSKAKSPKSVVETPEAPGSPKSPKVALPATPATPRRAKFTWMPFSTGPRHCIGQEFAMLEIRSLLSQILVRYRFTLAPDHPPVKPKAFSLVVLRPNTRINMCVERR